MSDTQNYPAQPADFLTLLKQHDERRVEHQKVLSSLITSTPVADDLLEEIARLPSRDREAVLRHHPGHEIERKLQSLWSMLSIFDKTYIDLLAQLDRFHAFSITDEMHLPIGRTQLEAIELAVNKELVAFSAAAGALVDFSRRLREAVVIPNFNTQRVEIFDDEQHKFVIALRNVIFHMEFPDVNWQIKYATERETDFVMPAEGLRHHGELSSGARSFVDRYSSSGIYVRALAESYTGRVRRFYDWYRRALEANVPEPLADYRRILRACTANTSRSVHRLLIQQYIANKVNPYDHLHKVLLPAQIEEALKLSMRSKGQVDYIITGADTYCACDDELRQLVYQLFGVSE